MTHRGRSVSKSRAREVCTKTPPCPYCHAEAYPVPEARMQAEVERIEASIAVMQEQIRSYRSAIEVWQRHRAETGGAP
jgi:hypothetical protein